MDNSFGEKVIATSHVEEIIPHAWQNNLTWFEKDHLGAQNARVMTMNRHVNALICIFMTLWHSFFKGFRRLVNRNIKFMSRGWNAPTQQEDDELLVLSSIPNGEQLSFRFGCNGEEFLVIEFPGMNRLGRRLLFPSLSTFPHFPFTELLWQVIWKLLPHLFQGTRHPWDPAEVIKFIKVKWIIELSLIEGLTL